MSTVHVFCPLCKIGSPREWHELAAAWVICTVCGRRMTQGTIDSALRRREKPNEPDPVPDSLVHWWSRHSDLDRDQSFRNGKSF